MIPLKRSNNLEKYQYDCKGDVLEILLLSLNRKEFGNYYHYWMMIPSLLTNRIKLFKDRNSHK